MRNNLVSRWLLIIALGIMTFAVSACLDTTEPSWFRRDSGLPPLPDGDGLTAVKAGQPCTPEQLSPPANALRVHFIDVGQGDAIWVQSPDGRNILVDAGDGGFFGRTDAAPIVTNDLTKNGVPPGATFDTIVVTHPHSDHYGGFIKLTNNYGHHTYIDPGVNGAAVSYDSLVTRLTNNAERVFRPAIGTSNALVAERGGRVPDFVFGPDVQAWLLAGESTLRLGSSQGSKINNTSLVFRLVYHGRSIMLMGDAEEDVEFELLRDFSERTAEPRLNTNILKVGHHGSTTSSSLRFIDTIFGKTPYDERYAIISSGRLSFSGTQLPAISVVHLLNQYMPLNHVFSTEAGDDAKTEEEAVGDDHILAVIKADSSFYVCYTEHTGLTFPDADEED